MDRLTVRRIARSVVLALMPALRRIVNQRDDLVRNHGIAIREESACHKFVDSLGAVIQFRLAYHEIHGRPAPYRCLPGSRPWPVATPGLSYRDKLLGSLPIADGMGAELGPLDLPLVLKTQSQVIYVDHLDTAGLHQKYPHLPDIVPIDRPIVDDNLELTLRPVAPLDYVVASQVMEHVANPIRWLQELAAVMRPSGRIALALPDRRMTFDLLRSESRAADLVSAYLMDVKAPDLRSVYDHHSQAALINMRWASAASVTPEEVVAGGGAVHPKQAADDHMALVRRALMGDYLDVHAWVFTPPTFLLVMAQLAKDGFLRFRLVQFYPTAPTAHDRDNAAFVVVLERCDDAEDPSDIRRSFLEPLWEN